MKDFQKENSKIIEVSVTKQENKNDFLTKYKPVKIGEDSGQEDYNPDDELKKTVSDITKTVFQEEIKFCKILLSKNGKDI